MLKYDPDHAPDLENWLELDEGTRTALVRQYHRHARVKAPSDMAHASMHVVVENQLAEGLPEARHAMERLRAEGPDRHEAIHAIAWVLSRHIWRLMNEPPAPVDPNAPYLAELDKLTAEAWQRSG